jgi:ferrochelatase
MAAMSRRVAVVLFNLGGPDRPDAVRPFLFNLFNDPAIIGLPALPRRLLATLVSSKREKEAKAIYARIGGKSPILELTWRQAHALQAALAGADETRVFVAMRYWHPMIEEAAREVAAFAPDDVVLLPLYPQFSTTTTESSLGEWRRVARRVGLKAPAHAVCCYPDEPSFIAAHAGLVRRALESIPDQAARILFSAHGLPEKVVARGDPYPSQVERTAQAVLAALGGGHDAVVCYQSRVGPLKWIGPSTEHEIERAGRDGRAVVLVPIAFVSEHSETLVELDLTYAELARERGVPRYVRVPALGDDPAFIAALAGLVRQALGRPEPMTSGGCERCPAAHRRCALASA